MPLAHAKRMQLRVVIAAVLGVGLGGLAGSWIKPGHAEPPKIETRVVAGERVIEQPQAVSCTAQVSRGELQSLRRELREEKTSSAEVASMPPLPEPSDDDAYARAQTRLDTAFGAGEWTQQDVAALHPLLGKLTRAHREEIVGRLFTAINS